MNAIVAVVAIHILSIAVIVIVIIVHHHHHL
jgi:hypothetical protein